MQNLKFSGCMTVSGLCMHDFGARASAPWKIFCCLLKFLLKKCYKCRVGSEKSESRGVGWLIEPRSLLGGASKSPHACTSPASRSITYMLGVARYYYSAVLVLPATAAVPVDLHVRVQCRDP